MSDDSRQVQQAIQRTLQTLFQAAYEAWLRKQDKDLEAELAKQMVEGQGSIHGSAVYPDHLEKIKQELINKKIPFFVMNNKTGQQYILVREKHKTDLLNIEEMISMQDTKLSKELSLNSALALAESRNINRLITLSFNDKDMAEIAKQKLFQSGIVFTSCHAANKTHLSVFPNSLFKENGKDLEFFKLNYSLLQSRDIYKTDKETESYFLTLRKEQAKFDKNTIEHFVQQALYGKHVILGDNNGAGKLYIEAKNKEFIVHDRIKDITIPIEVLKSDAITDVYSTLSRYTENIYNMNVFDGDFYNENLLNDYSSPEIKKAYKRPKIDAEHQQLKELHQFLSHNCESFVKEVNETATKWVMAKDDYLSLTEEQKAAYKHENIEIILTDMNHPIIQNFLTHDSPIPTEERENILHQMYENFSNENQNTLHSVDVNYTYAQQLREIANSQDEKTVEEIEMEHEYE